MEEVNLKVKRLAACDGPCAVASGWTKGAVPLGRAGMGAYGYVCRPHAP